MDRFPNFVFKEINNDLYVLCNNYRKMWCLVQKKE
jgi:hypothetical protein